MHKSPFVIEHTRNNLAVEKNLEDLKKTYSSNFPEIDDTNSSSFWNERLNKKHILRDEDGMTQMRIKIAAQYLPNSVRDILDIGIGYGFIEELLYNQKRNVNFYGNDISEVAIEYIRNRFPGIYKVESIYNMKYKKGFFDAVFLLEVLEHIPPSKTFKVLAKIKEILKKNGYFILSVPMNEGLENMNNNPNGHVRMYTRALIASELKIAGFKVISYREIYAFSSFFWIKSQLSKVWKRWEPNNIILLAQSL